MSVRKSAAAIILDFDGVVVDSETLQARVWEDLARELGFGLQTVTAQQIAGRLDSEVARELFGDGVNIAECLERKVRLQMQKEAAGELEFVPGFCEFLPKAGDFRLAICSNSCEDRLRQFLEEHELAQHFDAVVGHRAGEKPKPAPDPYLRVLSALRLPPELAVAVEDSAPGIVAARAAGIFAIQLQFPGMPAIPEADFRIDNFSALFHILEPLQRRSEA